MDGGLFDLYIQQLKAQPDVNQVKQALESFSSSPLTRIQSFNLTSTLLDHTIPQIYNLTDVKIQTLIINAVLSIQGIGGLMNKIKALSQQNDDIKSVVDTYARVLSKVFGETLLEKLKSTNALEINEVNKLLFQGQCLAVFNEYHLENEEMLVFASTDCYVTYLANQLSAASISHDEFNKYLVSLLSLNESSFLWVYDVFFTESNLPVFINHYKTMTQIQKRCCTLNLIKYISRRYHDDSSTKIQALAVILKDISTTQIFESLTEVVIKMLNKSLTSIFCLVLYQICKDLPAVFKKVLLAWGDPFLIKSESITIQESRTFFIIQLLYLQSTAFSKTLLSLPEFLDAISNHLNSFSNAIKTFGVIFADKVCEISKRDKIFLMEGLEGYEYLTDSNTYVLPSDISNPWNILSEATVSEHIEEIPTRVLTEPMENLSVYQQSEQESDSDDDDPSVVSKPKLLPPIYIKQLLGYLSVNKDHPQAYEMTKLALTMGPTLIRQKAQFGTEVSSVSQALLSILIGLGNDFNQPNFEELKLNCIVSVLVASPESAIEICKMLGNGDFSLQQRITILSALSLAARDIRGFKDDSVSNSYKETSFPTKQLPPSLHQKYISIDDHAPLQLEAAHLSIQDSLLAEESESAKDQISGGKVLRISRRLTKKTAGMEPKYKDYSSLISKNFYFPLTHLWYQSGGINIGHYSTILIGHYLKTLALLLHCSYSSFTNNDMIREFFIIVHDVLLHLQIDELQTIEGMVTGLLLICDISDEEHLLINYGTSLIETRNWMAENWEKIIDERIKSLCAGFLLRVTKILEKYQATMINQVNSIYE